ncbi:MAG: glutamine-synthetase adenylyltransferase [Pseudomonadota bacterium]
MTFAAHMTKAPRAYDPQAGADAWARVSLAPSYGDLIKGAAGSSPFLKTLIEREGEWLETALVQTPQAAFQSLLDATDALDRSDLKSGLRRVRGQVALFTALADLSGVWSLAQTTKALTDFADHAVTRAFGATVAREQERNKLPATLTDRPMSGLVVLAMGKMGAHELNYSSDIDLIVLFDETAFAADDFEDARHAFVRATRNAVALLSDLASGGFVFRTDLRLRPDPSVTPVALSMAAAERYYEGLGRTWERAAYIKARPAAGDIAAGAAFLGRLSPFIWRRHLDFAALRDAHDIRLKIQTHKRTPGLPAYQGRNLKLGPGGIREIEFFTQTRQLIAGGRDPTLRPRQTLEGLAALAQAGWVTPDECETLGNDYVSLRDAEHRIQMIADQQTHTVPTSQEGFARMAALMDRDPDDLGASIEERGNRVAAIADGFFAPKSPDTRAQTALSIPETWVSFPALRSARAVEIFERLRPVLIERIAQTSKPEIVLERLGGFLAGLPAGVQIFSLFEANPQLIELLVDICDTAPDLADHLGRNGAVLDAVIAGGFFDDWPGLDGVTRDLTARTRAGDYEDKLNALRRYQKEWQFRIGVHLLRGLINAKTAGIWYAELAEAVVTTLWPIVVADFTSRFGAVPGRGAAVLAMGSLGAKRLHAASDLDLILIYDAPPDAQSSGQADGRKPLAAGTYYARLTKALVTALNVQMGDGKLYDVDMRLRPSGRQGPVATGFSAFKAYQQKEAWVWEHLALTRARPIVGAPDLCAAIEEVRAHVLSAPKPAGQTLRELAEMRRRLASVQGSDAALEVRSGPGRLQDIELLAQTASYLCAGVPGTSLADHMSQLWALGLVPDEHTALERAIALYWSVQAVRQLAGLEATSDRGDITGGVRAFLLRETGCETLEDLLLDLNTTAQNVTKIVNGAIDAKT